MAVSLIPYLGIAALFIHGGHVEIPAGALATAKLAEDFSPMSPANASPPPPSEAPAKGPSS
jgi:hypothetical protein